MILLASDREPSATEIENILSRHGHTVFRAHTGRIALVAARGAQPELILVDAFLPETDGLALCRSLRDDPEVGPSRPIVLITGSRPTLAEHRSAMRAGVWGFVVEPFHADELTGKVDGYLLATLELEKTAPEGPLLDESGFYTAEGLARRARELALQAFNHHAGFACVVLAPAQERDAQRVARRLKALARRSDAIGRVGPAQFAIVAPGTDARGAVLMAERLAREIAAEGDGPPPQLRAGYDAVPNLRRAPLEPRHLLERATAALARARVSGRGAWIRGYD
ncbi:MAG TPA: response regulator [Gemmatimonadales bacterium]|nr:response regulator [Gemmatimonadales bacterium]